MPIQTIDRGTAGDTNDKFKIGTALDVCQANDNYLDTKINSEIGALTVATFAALASTPATAGQIVTIKCHTSGVLGSGQFEAVSGSITNDGGTQINSATVGIYWKRINFDFITPHMFGSLYNGSDDGVGFNLARIYAQSTGVPIRIPAGTCLISSASQTTFTSGNITIVGDGVGISTLKPMNSANMSEFLTYTGTGKMTVRDLTINGNRTNGGTSNTTGYCLYISGNDAHIDNVEITESNFAGVFVGSNSGLARSYEFKNCNIHDNGSVDAGHNGVGIYGGGSTPVAYLLIDGCRFENNYCINASPGDSTAVNITVGSVKFINNTVINNYNVNGGQVAISDNGTGSGNIHSIVANNLVIQSGAFGGDLTCGIEINGGRFIVCDNIIYGCTSDGIRVEGDSSKGLIHDNYIDIGIVAGTGINIITSGGTGGSKILIHDNEITAGLQGLSLQSGYTQIYARNNYISGVTTAIAGDTNFQEIRGNFGYSPSNVDITAGASVWTSTAVNYDCLIVLKTPNGISDLSFGGAPLQITTGTSFFVKAQRQFLVTWAGAAPVFSYIQQQR